MIGNIEIIKDAKHKFVPDKQLVTHKKHNKKPGVAELGMPD